VKALRLPRPLVGVGFAVPLRGHFHRFDSPLVDRAIDCHLAFELEGMRQSVLHRVGRVSGWVTASGLARAPVLDGAVTYREASEGQAIVTLHFASDGEAGSGERLTLRGFVEVLPVAPLTTATTMPFSLYSASDQEIGRGVLRFDLRGDLGRVVRSLRPRLRIGLSSEGPGT
jgi:hypothetical protein